MRFRDRVDAGRQLAPLVVGLGLQNPVVLALPRGGVPVASVVASALGAPLEVFVARKVGAPGHRELGIGAIAEEGEAVADPDSLRYLRVSPEAFAELADQERVELERRVRHYRGGRPLPLLEQRDVVLVDDGLATGVTAEASLRALRGRHPRRLVLAVPVAAADTADRLRALADEVITVQSPIDFRAVGQWYDDFSQTTDDEVTDLLTRSLSEHPR
ncbi:MAG: phosphoribosyltransferase [Acidimicrobiales bacterium]